MNSGFSRSAVVVFLSATFGFAQAAQAEFVNCPNIGGLFTCTVAIGDTSLTIESTIDETVGFRWTVNGVEHLALQDFSLYDQVFGSETDDQLAVARFDADAGVIEKLFVDPGRFSAGGVITLTEVPGGAQLDEQIAVTPFALPPFPMRFYAYVNFNLGGDEVDDSAQMGSDTLLVQRGGEFVATLEIIDGRVPDAFQIAEYPWLANALLFPPVLEQLDNTVVSGPIDFEQAWQWDNVITAVGIPFELHFRVIISTDSDHDGIPDNVDNCLEVGNVAQRDTDGDNIGSYCDPDIALPNDCLVNFADLSEVQNAFFSNMGTPGWNADADFNGDGAVNFGDLTVMKTSFFGTPGPSGLPNDCDQH